MEFLRENKAVLLIAFCIFWACMSFITYIFYMVDKKKAQAHKWRIKEATLLTLPWIFGSIGGILGMYVLRHKTKHWYFVVNDWLALIVYIALFIGLILV